MESERKNEYINKMDSWPKPTPEQKWNTKEIATTHFEFASFSLIPVCVHISIGLVHWKLSLLNAPKHINYVDYIVTNL